MPFFLFILLVVGFLCLWELSYKEYIKDLFCLLGDWGRWSHKIFLIFVPGSWKEKKLAGVFVLPLSLPVISCDQNFYIIINIIFPFLLSCLGETISLQLALNCFDTDDLPL